MNAVDGEDAQHEVVQRQDAHFGKVHWLALILLGGSVALAPIATQRWGFRGFLVAYLLGTTLWLLIARRRLSLATTLAIALGLRALLLAPDPHLSGDVYRYLSDGRVVAAGGNPYEYTPSDPRINHPEIRSIYPPLAQLLFGAVHDLTLWRLLLIAADLAVIVLLPGSAALAYATCPLVLFEGTWNGHIDLLAGGLLGVALLRRSALSAALAGGLKIIPLAALPGLIRRSRTPKRDVLIVAAVLLLPLIPFLGGAIMPGFRDYATRWIFNSPLYAGIRFVVEQVPTREIWTHHPLRVPVLSDRIYRLLYPDFLTRAILGVLAIGAIALSRRVSTAVAALLLCSPAIHPWYWLTFIPCALVERSRWLFVALMMPVSYLLYDETPALMVYALTYGLALAAVLCDRRASVAASTTARI